MGPEIDLTSEQEAALERACDRMAAEREKQKSDEEKRRQAQQSARPSDD